MPMSGLSAAEDTDCISEDVVLQFLAGEMSGAELSRIEQHLVDCGACRRVIAVVGAHIRSIDKLASRATSDFAKTSEADAVLRSLRTVDEIDYVVERELARGGMGRILLATDRQGRGVAIKVLIGSDERATRRFLREMQVTARLQHPSIITLYEAGRWPSGEPFFAMKLVQGRSLREELATRPALKERLALVPRLIAVTDALAYAHDQGVIHRDLKPGNILVGAFGETVVIDWGLARMRGLPSSEASEPSAVITPAPRGDDTTQFGTPIGTPAYMAPEQARGEELDERADVYGLGALLYHVLCGRAPYSGVSPRDVLAQVLAGPPVSLSERMLELPADLVAIVEKAMMPDANQRYASAQSMSEDLRRFAAGQLVSAHIYSIRTLVRRWGRKHRAALGVAAALLMVGVIAGWFSIDRVIEERNRAEVERRIATTHHTAAEGLVTFLITEFRERVSRADRMDLVDGLGDRVSEYYREIDQAGMPLEPSTFANRATALQGLAGLESERRDLRKARLLYQQALEAWSLADRSGALSASDLAKYGKTWQLVGLLEHLEGNADTALAAYRAAIELSERSTKRDPEYLEGYLLGAATLGWMSETLQQRTGDLEGSFDATRRGIERLEPLLVKHSDRPELLRRLAFLNQQMSDRQLALGHLDEAASCIKRSGELYLQVLAASSDNLTAAREYAYTFVFLGTVEIARGRLTDALVAVDTTIERFEVIVQRDPGNLASQEDLGVAYAYKCDFERRALRLEPAEAACRKSIALFREHQKLERASTNTVSLLVLALTNLGRVESAAHRSSSASETLGDAVAAARGLVQSDPGSGKWKEDLLASLTGLVDSELKLGRLDDAAQHVGEALALAEDLAQASTESSDVQNSLGRIRIFAGDVAIAQRRPEAAASSYVGARQTYELLLRRSPRVVDFQTSFVRVSIQLANALEATEGARCDDCIRYREDARAILEELRREGRLYPEDESLSAMMKIRKPEAQPRGSTIAGQ